MREGVDMPQLYNFPRGLSLLDFSFQEPSLLDVIETDVCGDASTEQPGSILDEFQGQNIMGLTSLSGGMSPFLQ